MARSERAGSPECVPRRTGDRGRGLTELAGISGREARRAFEKDGWIFVRQNGSHVILKKPGRRVTLSIPDHRTLKVGLLRRLIRDAELSLEQFLNLRT